jgi:hypothetical protein
LKGWFSTMEGIDFNQIYGRDESAYSKVVAQSIALSEGFRKEFFEQVHRIHADARFRDLANKEVIKVRLEKTMGQQNRIDILLQFENSLNVGIENKKWAGLQPNQLTRYMSQLESLGFPYILVFLTPPYYHLSDANRPQAMNNGVFVHIDYNEVHRICETILTPLEDGFERRYFMSLRSYLDEVVTNPIDTKDVAALSNYGQAKRKLDLIMNEISPDGGIEDTRNYLLVRRIIKGHNCYLGFRFTNHWYFDDPLIEGQPELVYFIKDTVASADYSKVLKGYFEANRAGMASRFSCKVQFIEGVESGKCRLALQRPLESFVLGDLKEIIAWFRDVQSSMENDLPVYQTH